MKAVHILYFLVIILAGSPVLAQDQATSTRLIKYDPLFWKSELHLNALQSTRIREINHQFYEELLSTYNRNQDDRTAIRTKVSESLKNRSQLIWETLEPKQRRKLERLINENYHI